MSRLDPTTPTPAAVPGQRGGEAVAVLVELSSAYAATYGADSALVALGNALTADYQAWPVGIVAGGPLARARILEVIGRDLCGEFPWRTARQVKD